LAKTQRREDWIEYKNLCKIVKSVVSKGRLSKCDEYNIRDNKSRKEEKNL